MKTRIRETQLTDPQGMDGVRHTLVRVVEIDGPAPDGADVTKDEPHEWRIAPAVDVPPAAGP